MNHEQQQSRTVRELFDLTDNVAIVTGGAGEGFGSQIAQALAEAGARVIITSRNEEKAHRKAKEFVEKGLRVDGASLELTSEHSVLDLVRIVIDRYKHIDVLFNSAAHNHVEPLETVALDDWNKVLAVNITGTMLMSRAAAPHMLKQGRGVIVNISSIYGMVSPDQRIYGHSGINSPLIYGVTKAAVIQMTRFMATYWAPHIRVNCITPGGLYNSQDRGFVEKYVDRTPLGRMGGSYDLKGAAAYFASDASAWVTGHNLVVDGGWTIW